MAPAASSAVTTAAECAGSYANAGHAAVVGRPNVSMLSLTPQSAPNTGDARARAGSAASILSSATARSRNAAGDTVEIQIGWPRCDSGRASQTSTISDGRQV